MTKRSYKRKWSNFLLNGDVQLHYIVAVLAAVTLICTSLGFLIYQQEASAVRSIQELMGGSVLELEDATLVADDLASGKMRLLLQMVGVGILMMMVIFLYLVVMTHKVAGPIHKMSGYLEQMKQGQLHNIWALRKGDLLVPFYDQFRKTHGALRARHCANNEVIGRFLDVTQEFPEQFNESSAKQVLDDVRSHYEERKNSLS